ncbi:HpcH/HpaI aldolase/citrate lyase family protein [Nocardioides pacificus]
MVTFNAVPSQFSTSTRRSVLSVPAGDGRKLRKALGSGADEVVIDLEDAVAVGDKERGRRHLAEVDWAGVAQLPRISVRVNAPRTAWCHRDLEVVVAHVPAASVVVPKVESRADVGFVERLLDGLESEVGRPARVAVQALVETARGVAALADIVSGVDRLESVIVGYADLAASLGRARDVDPAVWRPVQDAVVLHAAAAGVESIDGPFLGVDDDGAFRAAVRGARQAGFDAKWVIHPRQLDAVNDVFTPSADEVDHARRVLMALDGAAGAGRGACVVDGALVDEAMALAARHVLSKASDVDSGTVGA